MRRAWMAMLCGMAPAALASPSSSWGASFDCSRASTVEEHAICADPRLSALDDRLGAAFAQARKSSASDPHDRAVVQAVGRVFQAQRRRCGADRSCLVGAYAGALEGYGAAGASAELPAWIDATVIAGGAATSSATLPTTPGRCVATRIAKVHPRLGDGGPVKDADYDSGTGVEFTNGGYQVSYNREPALLASRPGDGVTMCLISIPQRCPPGDDRGRFYLVTNMRTKQTWTLPDSQHSCGGA